jgi:hypothetical protein
MRINIVALTRHLLSSGADGRSFLEALVQHGPGIVPERIGQFEPLREAFTSVEKALPFWRDPFLWSRKAPRIRGNVFPGGRFSGGGRVHGWITMQVEVAKAQTPAFQECREVLYAWCRSLDADFAAMHVLDAGEEERGIGRETVMRARGGAYLSIVPQGLRSGLPDVYWLTILGKSYVDAIGLSRVLSSPAAKVEQLGDDLVALQATASIADVTAGDGKFQAAREIITDHIGRAWFQGVDGVKVPAFSL